MSLVNQPDTASESARKVGKISIEFSALNDAICSLESMVDQLITRVKPALSPIETEREEKSSGNVVPDEAMSDTSIAINESRKRIMSCVINMHSIINRIEL